MEYTGSKAVAFVPQSSKAVKRLIEVGLVPAECTRFELVMEVNNVIRATCTFNVTEDQLAQIAKAYEDYPEEARGIVREIVRLAKPLVCADCGSQAEMLIGKFCFKCHDARTIRASEV